MFKFKRNHLVISFMMVAVANITWGTQTNHPGLERLTLWVVVTIYLAWLEANPTESDSI